MTVTNNAAVAIGTAQLAADNKTVTVVTRDLPAATAADEPFHLTVTC